MLATDAERFARTYFAEGSEGPETRTFTGDYERFTLTSQ
jgi:hypothetical protein